MTSGVLQALWCSTRGSKKGWNRSKCICSSKSKTAQIGSNFAFEGSVAGLRRTFGVQPCAALQYSWVRPYEMLIVPSWIAWVFIYAKKTRLKGFFGLFKRLSPKWPQKGKNNPCFACIGDQTCQYAENVMRSLFFWQDKTFWSMSPANLTWIPHESHMSPHESPSIYLYL